MLDVVRGVRSVGWRAGYATVAGRHAARREKKKKDAPPETVVNFRNMQRRRGGEFRTDTRFTPHEKGRGVPSLREHLYKASHEVAELAKGADPATAFHDAHAKLQTRMDEWHAIARRIRMADHDADFQPQHAAAAWNQVILLAVKAGMPSAAWRTYCEMKRAHVRPTARTYAGYFAALTAMVRSHKVDVKVSGSWIEHLPKLYDGLEQIHEAGASVNLPDLDVFGTPAESATGGTLRPSVAKSKSRVVREMLKDPQAVVAAYSAYISLLFALQRPDEALAVWDSVCPDPYPGRRMEETVPRLPRRYFATAQTYTAILRDLGTCRMPLKAKQQAVQDIWARWQYDILQTTRAHSAKGGEILDAKAVKTLVWTLAIGHPPTAKKSICALLGTYCGIAFTRTPAGIRYSVPSTWNAIPFTIPALLVDVLAFFDREQMYAHVLDCYEHAMATKSEKGAVNPESIPEAMHHVRVAQEKLAEHL